jgi:hypothetical protein
LLFQATHWYKKASGERERKGREIEKGGRGVYGRVDCESERAREGREKLCVKIKKLIHPRQEDRIHAYIVATYIVTLQKSDLPL